MTDTARRLVLLRHATAEPAASGADDARRLSDTGLAEAEELGRWLKDEGLLAEAVVCSPAVRTRETWAAIQEVTGHGVLIDMDPRVYEAGPDDLLGVVGDLEATHPEARVAIVVGHAPGIPALAYDLCGGVGDAAAVDTLTRGFVPASAAVLDVEGAWGDVGRGTGVLAAVRAGDARPH